MLTAMIRSTNSCISLRYYPLMLYDLPLTLSLISCSRVSRFLKQGSVDVNIPLPGTNPG